MPQVHKMNNFISIFIYISITIAVLQNVFIVAIPLAIWFTFRCGAGWLLPLALLIDGYFGAFYTVPYFSITIIFWFFITEIVRPRLIISESYE